MTLTQGYIVVEVVVFQVSLVMHSLWQPRFVILVVLLVSSVSAWKQSFRRAVASIACATLTGTVPHSAHAATTKSISDVPVIINGEKKPMKTFLGEKATLVVNFPGQCDLPGDGDPQCKGLSDLYKKYSPSGFNMVLFPTEQFRDQSMMGEREPEDDIREELAKRYSITSPIMDYVDVNGGGAAQLYKEMKEIKGISTSDLKKIDWNYEKFLIDSEGIPIRRYRPNVMPEVVGKDVDSFINKGKLPIRKKAELGAV